MREELYRAYATRASDQGPNAGKWDNSAVINEILELRHTLAQTLGFAPTPTTHSPRKWRTVRKK